MHTKKTNTHPPVAPIAGRLPAGSRDRRPAAVSADGSRGAGVARAGYAHGTSARGHRRRAGGRARAQRHRSDARR